MTNLTSKSFKGYGCDVQWDGTTLTARGSNKATHLALLGPTTADRLDRDEFVALGHRDRLRAVGSGVRAIATVPDELTLNRFEIEVVEYKHPTLLVNGKLVLRSTVTDREHTLHFLRKHTDDFDTLVSELS